MKKRENEKLCCENERNVPHLLQVNNIFVARRLECIGIPPTFSSPTLFSSVVLVDDDSASIRSLLGCSDANEESSRVFIIIRAIISSSTAAVGKRRLGDDFPRRLFVVLPTTILQTTMHLSSFSLRKNDSDDEKKKKKKKSLSILIFGGGGGRGGARKRESSGTNGTSCLIFSLFRRRKVREIAKRLLSDAIS